MTSYLISICNLLFVLQAPLWCFNKPQDLKNNMSVCIDGYAWPCGFAQSLIQRHERNPITANGEEILFKAFQVPPESQDSTYSPSHKFMLHFDRSGVHAVPAEDLSDNGIPDYIDSAGVILDHTWDVEIETLGFQAPLNIDGEPATVYHVYFQDLFGVYGNTVTIDEIPGISEAQRYTSYIILENDYLEGDFFVQGLEALKVTAAHEFNHAIQLSYGVWWDNGLPVDLYLMEMTSTWIEDIVYENINRYVQFLPDLFETFSNTPLTYSEGLYPYGNALFLHMLEKKFGSQIVIDIWEQVGNHIGIIAIEEALSDYSTSLSTQLHQYGLWLLFTGDRNNSQLYFPEGQLYPELRVSADDRYYFFDTADFQTTVSAYASRILQITVPRSGDYSSRTMSTLSNVWTSHIIESQIIGPITSSQQSLLYLESNNPATVLITNPNMNTAEVQYHLFSDSEKISGSLSVYPNPINLNEENILTVDNVPSGGSVHIFTADGNAVTKIPIPQNALNISWDLTYENGEPIAGGVYLFLVKGNGIEEVVKLMVIR